jgi:hypothetical protein
MIQLMNTKTTGNVVTKVVAVAGGWQAVSYVDGEAYEASMAGTKGAAVEILSVLHEMVVGEFSFAVAA